MASSIPQAPPPGSIPQPKPDGLPHENVPDWNNIGLFTAGIAVGAILGATVALLLAPASGDDTRDRITRRFRGDDDDVWEDLAEELELAAAEREEAANLSAES
ncbi:MAG TPA: YtxH domain-containing protein [Gemmatimonadaceae bacterium]